MIRNTFTATLLGVVALALAGGTSIADDAKSEKFSDEMFVRKAASGGMHEVELGQVVSTRVKSADVKAFAERMVTDHTKANQKLKAAAETAGIAVPEKMTEKQQKELARFKDLKGGELDREYIAHMVKDHEEDVALFREASQRAKNTELKKFASDTLPTLQEHLKVAKQLHTQMVK